MANPPIVFYMFINKSNKTLQINIIIQNFFTFNIYIVKGKWVMNLEYVIGNFETLEDVAKKFDVSVLELKKFNNITQNIVPQSVLIPHKKQNMQFKVLANLRREFVYFGNSNLVKSALNKNGFVASVYSDCITLFKPKNSNVFVVGVLDTLNGICARYNLNKQDVILLNNLKTEKLFIGQILKLK